MTENVMTDHSDLETEIRLLLDNVIHTLEPSRVEEMKVLVLMLSVWLIEPPIAPNPQRYLTVEKGTRLGIGHMVETATRNIQAILEVLDAEQQGALQLLLEVFESKIGPPGRDSLGRSTRCLYTPLGRIPF